MGKERLRRYYSDREARKNGWRRPRKAKPPRKMWRLMLVPSGYDPASAIVLALVRERHRIRLRRLHKHASETF